MSDNNGGCSCSIRREEDIVSSRVMREGLFSSKTLVAGSGEMKFSQVGSVMGKDISKVKCTVACMFRVRKVRGVSEF